MIVICAVFISRETQAQSAPTNWTGFYGGANFGYSSDSFNFGETSESFAISGFSGTFPGRSVQSGDSLLAGGQIGYNQQFGTFVVGLEWDTDWISHRASLNQALEVIDNSVPFNIAFVDSHHSVELDLINALRARAGVAWRSLFVYASGGLALGDLTVQVSDTSFLFPNPAQGGMGTDNDLALGWAAGAGVEWSITPAVSLALDYRHIDIGGSFSPTINPQLFRAHEHVDFSDDEASLRVNLHLSAFFHR